MPRWDEVLPYLKRIDAARWYTNFGPLATELEARIAALLPDTQGRVPATASFANATLALELAMLAHELPERSRVLMPALTFVATPASVIAAGHVPVICDVDEASWLLTPEITEPLLRETGAIAVLPVSTYGCPQDVAAWDALSVRTGATVVIDAAAAFSNQTRSGKSTLVFSLHATKALGAGEGAAAMTTDRDLVDAMRRLSNFGIQLPQGLVHRSGTNAKLSEYHAAVALASLDGWAERRSRRQRAYQWYLRALAQHCPAVSVQQRPADGVYSIMPVLLPENVHATKIAGSLEEQGIDTRRWYCPTLERHPAFRDLPVAGTLRAANRLNDRLLALPFHTQLLESDVDFVCETLAAVLRSQAAS